MNINKQQRAIIAVVIPVLFFVVAFSVAEKIFDLKCETYFACRALAQKMGVSGIDVSAFDLTVTWWIWCIYIVLIAVCEVYLFSSKD